MPSLIDKTNEVDKHFIFMQLLNHFPKLSNIIMLNMQPRFLNYCKTTNNDIFDENRSFYQ